MLAATLLWRTIITGKTDVVRTSCSSVLLPRDEMVAVNSPGPGAYSPTSAFHSASSPRYSMGLKNATPERNKQLFRSASTTDVGTYDPEAGQNARASTRSPSYTMGSPRSHSYIRPTSSPGPQHYAEKSVAGKDSLLKKSPSFSMGLKNATTRSSGS